MHKLLWIFIVYSLTSPWAQAQELLTNSTAIAEQNSTCLSSDVLEAEKDNKAESYLDWEFIKRLWPYGLVISLEALKRAYDAYVKHPEILPDEVLEGKLPESKYPDIKRLPRELRKFIGQHFAHGFFLENPIPDAKTDVLWIPGYFLREINAPVSLPTSTQTVTLGAETNKLHDAIISQVKYLLEDVFRIDVFDALRGPQLYRRELTNTAKQKKDNFKRILTDFVNFKLTTEKVDVPESIINENIELAENYALKAFEQAIIKSHEIRNDIQFHELFSKDKIFDAYALYYTKISELFDLVPIPQNIAPGSAHYVLLEQLQPIVSQFITSHVDDLLTLVKEAEQAPALNKMLNMINSYFNGIAPLKFLEGLPRFESRLSKSQLTPEQEVHERETYYNQIVTTAITTISDIFKEIYVDGWFNQDEIEWLGVEFNHLLKLFMQRVQVLLELKNAQSMKLDEDKFNRLKANLGQKLKALELPDFPQIQAHRSSPIGWQAHDFASKLRAIYKDFYWSSFAKKKS